MFIQQISADIRYIRYIRMIQNVCHVNIVPFLDSSNLRSILRLNTEGYASFFFSTYDHPMKTFNQCQKSVSFGMASECQHQNIWFLFEKSAPAT